MRKLILFLFVFCSVFYGKDSLLTPYQSLDVNDFEQVREELRNPYQLYNYIREEFTYSSDTKFSNFYDYWMPAKDMFVRKTGDCDDYANFCLNILSYHEYKSIFVAGWYGVGGHAVTLFYWRNKWHCIGNTHERYNEYNSSDNINTIGSNYGFTSSLWYSYTNSISGNKLVFSSLDNNKSRWINMDRVAVQQYVTSALFYGNQKFSFDYSFSPYLWNKNKMSFAFMSRLNKWLKLGASYSVHGYYLDMFNPIEFGQLNHVLWLHSSFFNIVGVSAYYDVSQKLYKGIDVDFKPINIVGRLFGMASKMETYVAFRNGFQVIDADIRIWWSSQFYTYIIKRDQHFMGQFYYELMDRDKIKNKVIETNYLLGMDYMKGIVVTNRIIRTNYRSPDINTFVNLGLYLDTDYNVGFFAISHKWTAWLYFYDIDFDFNSKNNGRDFINILNNTFKLRLTLQVRI